MKKELPKTYSPSEFEDRIYADWCEKYGFKYADKWIPDKWLRERKRAIKGLILKKKK